MNSVGRIFIVLIFIMSLVFMSFTIAVYSTSNNWKEESEKQKASLKKAQEEKGQVEQRMAELQKSLDEQLKAAGDTIIALHSEAETLAKEQQETTQKLDGMQNDNTMMAQTIKETHITLAHAQAEQMQLRNLFRDTQQSWNALLSDYVKKTDEAHTLSMQLDNLEKVSQELVGQYANAKSVLNQFNLKPNPEMYAGVPPFQVTGRITEVRATGLVEVTVGEDSGLMKGHQLDVYRKAEDGRDMYLGVVEVVLTEPNRAACKVLPEYRKGTVQINDVVTSEFSQERQKYQLKRDAHVATNTN